MASSPGGKILGDFLDALSAIEYNSADKDWRTKIVGGTLTQGEFAGKETIGTYKSVISF